MLICQQLFFHLYGYVLKLKIAAKPFAMRRIGFFFLEDALE